MAKIVVSVGLLAVLLLGAGLTNLMRALADADRVWLLIGLLLGVLAAMLQANQWRGLLAAFGVPRTYGRCLRLDTASRLFDAALPTSIGGDVARIRLAGEGRREIPATALAVALRRIMSLPGLIVLIGVGLITSWPLPYAGGARAVAVGCLVGGVTIGVLVLGVQRLGRSHRLRLPGAVENVRRELHDARERSAGKGHPFARAAARGLLFWIVVVLSQSCYIRAMGVTAPLGYSLAVVTCVNAVSMLPISLGGYGLREGAFSALLGVPGLGTVAQGTAVGVCLSAQTVLFGLVGGVFYLTLGRNVVAEPTSSATSAAGVQPDMTLKAS